MTPMICAIAKGQSNQRWCHPNHITGSQAYVQPKDSSQNNEPGISRRVLLAFHQAVVLEATSRRNRLSAPLALRLWLLRCPDNVSFSNVSMII